MLDSHAFHVVPLEDASLDPIDSDPPDAVPHFQIVALRSFARVGKTITIIMSKAALKKIVRCAYSEKVHKTYDIVADHALSYPTEEQYFLSLGFHSPNWNSSVASASGSNNVSVFSGPP
jgi:hypothetical protein